MLPKKHPPTHPGQMLLHEFLEPMELTQKEFATHIGWTYARLNEIIRGKRGVTAESALALGDAFIDWIPHKCTAFCGITSVLDLALCYFALIQY